MAPALPWIATAVGAIGAGVSYFSGVAAADTQEQLALLNAQSQTQSIQQAGEVNRMQAAINEPLGKADEAAANANANMYREKAEADSTANREAIRQGREESARLLAATRTAIAKAQLVDTTASPLELMAAQERQKQMN